MVITIHKPGYDKYENTAPGDPLKPAYISGSRCGAPRSDYGRQGYSSGSSGGGWGNRCRRDWEVSPFGNDDIEAVKETKSDQESNVRPPVNGFAEFDLDDALNLNIRRCKYVKPTLVQYKILISDGLQWLREDDKDDDESCSRRS
ncbi:hypothetical protein L1987_49159 [Smallanthus sonchifolius]|uniref:Uncharacterized protein n=1 Tax=Smallanthus sonchifolius TaxID=185202 RepID=A0ACB9FTY5_9ASTR|nr:hypothetical protein L1987_49159 [Smallanthus sonchifolius]